MAQAIFAGAFGIFRIIALLASIFWIWMLVDRLTSKLAGNEKLVWVLVILFTHLLAATIYFVVARNGGARSASA